MNRAIIYLVGFMGAGKTSVGQDLARLLGWEFVDLDTAIEEREGVPIRDIFSQKGEPCFRAMESAALREVGRRRNLVVALGGGAFCSEANQEMVKSTGVSVWLDAPMELLQARCPSDGTRPLFSTPSEMAELLQRRLPFYSRADLRLDVTGLTIEDAAREIIRLCGRGSTGD
ncbi:MAG TPA: shikimate kinase [Acidobacteriota bacterium]|nr:shikimate kinase [Acidobacteriota bacterium]